MGSGFGMMIPALYLVLSIRKTRLHAERLGAMKQRLEVLTNLLDEGKESLTTRKHSSVHFKRSPRCHGNPQFLLGANRNNPTLPMEHRLLCGISIPIGKIDG